MSRQPPLARQVSSSQFVKSTTTAWVPAQSVPTRASKTQRGAMPLFMSVWARDAGALPPHTLALEVSFDSSTFPNPPLQHCGSSEKETLPSCYQRGVRDDRAVSFAPRVKRLWCLRARAGSGGRYLQSSP